LYLIKPTRGCVLFTQTEQLALHAALGYLHDFSEEFVWLEPIRLLQDVQWRRLASGADRLSHGVHVGRLAHDYDRLTQTAQLRQHLELGSRSQLACVKLPKIDDNNITTLHEMFRRCDPDLARAEELVHPVAGIRVRLQIDCPHAARKRRCIGNEAAAEPS